MLALTPLAAAEQKRPQTEIDLAFAKLYDLDFPGAHRILDEYIAKDPVDPLAEAVSAAAYMFQEFHRMKILETEFLTNDKKVSDKKKSIDPDPVVRKNFLGALDRTQTKAQNVLNGQPGDAKALFAMSLRYGLQSDYNSLVEKKQWASFTLMKTSNEFGVKLLQQHPDYVDAYLTSGMTEYIVGSLPFFLRWFIKIDGVEGTKEAARIKLERVSTSGRYLEPFAKILLALYWVREKQPRSAIPLLTELSSRFPNNTLYRSELAKLR